MISLILATVVQDPAAAPSDHELPVMFEVVTASPPDRLAMDESTRASVAATGLPWEIRHRASGIELLLVPPGRFQRGNPDLDPFEYGGSSNPWVRTVLVEEPFYLGRTEVTVEEWMRVMDPEAVVDPDTASLPRVDDEMAEIQVFLQRSKLDLPRDSEWEYACKAGTTADRYGELDYIAWHPGNSGRAPGEPFRAKPVGLKDPNPWGFHDMIGNVWETTATFQAAGWHGIPTDRIYRAVDDDIPRSPWYAIRGGCLGNGPDLLTAIYSGGYCHTCANEDGGFRAAWHFPGNKPPVVEDEMAAEAAWRASLEER